MKEETTLATKETIVEDVARKKADGWRLVSMTCVDLDETTADILYHFDKDLHLSHIRMTIAKAETVPSISSVYFAAMLSENEMQDHFGLSFTDLAVDFNQAFFLDEEVRHAPYLRYSVAEKGKE